MRVWNHEGCFSIRVSVHERSVHGCFHEGFHQGWPHKSLKAWGLIPWGFGTMRIVFPWGFQSMRVRFMGVSMRFSMRVWNHEGWFCEGLEPWGLRIYAWWLCMLAHQHFQRALAGEVNHKLLQQWECRNRWECGTCSARWWTMTRISWIAWSVIRPMRGQAAWSSIGMRCLGWLGEISFFFILCCLLWMCFPQKLFNNHVLIRF